MIARALANSAHRFGAETAVKTRGQSVQYSQLFDAAGRIAHWYAPYSGRRVAVCVDDLPLLIATLAGLDWVGATAVLLHPTTSAEAIRQIIDDHGIEAAASDRTELDLPVSQPQLPASMRGPTAAAAADPDRIHSTGSIVLFTSGTSGPPKPAVHTWQSLSAGVRDDERYQGRHWLLTYDPTRFAGIQVWLQSLLTGGQLSPAPRDPAETARVLVDDAVEYASGTPTFWRMLIVGAPRARLSQAPLVQITLGGEPPDQGLLDVLHETFPAARITQIYASTEMGVCFAVNDGVAGFPVDYLNDSTLPCQLRVSDEGELEIRSRGGMHGYLDSAEQRGDWFGTGDMVQRRGQRVHFVGRKSDTINVAGVKVYPMDVEQCIRQVPGVDDVRVRGLPSSVTGQLVGAQVQAAAGADVTALRAAILEACRGRLTKYQVPASIDFVDRLAVSQSGKVLRAAEAEAAHGA